MKKILFTFIVILLGAGVANITKAACGTGQSEIIINIVPDNWPTETSWNLKLTDGTIIASGTYNNDTICIPSGSCAIFTILDSYGDGIYTPGGYWLYLDGALVSTGSSFGFSTSIPLSCPPGSHCTNTLPLALGTYNADFDETWYTYTCTLTGLYEFSTCDSNICNTGIWLYSSCIGNYPEDATGTYAYNDDYCLQQSRVLTPLIAGHTYKVRIGDIQNDCNAAINFTFSYMGPITGCTDPASCNFNPNATVDDGSCIYYPNPLCQGPDLALDSVSFVNSLMLQTVEAQPCDVQEGCLVAYGTRKVIRFTSKINNLGTLDYYLGNVSTQPGMFNTNNCHGHAHYEGYGDYRLYDVNDNIYPVGHKNGYCVMDLCGFGQYNCGNMGITAGCYDVYGAGTQCQWVDITDVPTGDYRLAIIINALHLPDAFGHQETNYVNNAMQVCIHIEQDSINGPSFNLLPSCTPFLDCNGVPGGEAVVDCNGICGGLALGGDRQNDTLLTNADIQVYLNDFGNGINITSPCVDISGNGEESIYDAALAKWCSRNSYILYPGASPQYNCNFPRNIINPNEPTSLEIVNVNLAGGYLDINIGHSNSDVTAFQFSISGIYIQSVVSLVDPIAFPVELGFNPATNSIFGISLQDSSIERTITPHGLVRVYFSGVNQNWICISQIVDIVNSNGERTVTSIAGSCFPATITETIDADNVFYFHLVPNPAKDDVNILIQNLAGKNLMASLFDYSGRVIKEFQIDAHQTKQNFSIADLSQGIYFVRIGNDSFYRIEKLIKQ